LLQIIPTGVGSLVNYALQDGAFTTRPQSEPIQVSQKFYNNLASWFIGNRGDTTFCEFIDSLDININEKLSFLQVYTFDNENFVNAGSSTDKIDYYPSRYDTLNNERCLPGFETCNCKVITDGSNHSKPGVRNTTTSTITPRAIVKIERAPHDKTFVDLFEAGAAEFVSLRQDEGAGGMFHEMSNTPNSDDETVVTTEASRLAFFIGCINGSGYGTNMLPTECECSWPLYLSYEYTTNLYVSAQIGGCVFGSRGAGAQSEDLALVVAYNLKTGEVTPLDGNKAAIGRK
jgi:hypothetical protein